MANESVRLTAWNCAGGFHRKAKVLDDHATDIVVLSEAPNNCVSLAGDYVSGVWIGSNRGYGLAVLGMNGWKIEAVDIAIEDRLFLPVRAVRGSEQVYLVGVCAKRAGDYVAPTLRALSRLSAFISQKGAILAGDFNQSVKFDAKRGPAGHFGRVLDILESLGVVSAWHHTRDEKFGSETSYTYFHRWKQGHGFHIDYAFVPRGFAISSARLGTYDDFVAAGLSDHVPLLVDLKLPSSLPGSFVA
jgi:hypothetical protein